MRRAVQFVVRNWPLKLAAVAVATLLYAGLVLSQSAQVFSGNVPIVPLKLPTSAVLLGNLPPVTSIRYFAPPDVPQPLTTSSFTATVDLSAAEPQPADPFVIVKVIVRATDPRVTILDYDPPSIRVQLDPLVTKTVPIEVERGEVPPGLEIREPVVSASQAVVSGPESVVRLVTAAQARVVIQPSGIDVDQTVDLVAVDAQGAVQGQVNISPSSVVVKIAVGSGLQSKTLPVNPVVAGTPSAGYVIGAVSVTPATVTVEGDADALAGLTRVDTVPLSVSAASADLTREVALALPAGVAPLAGDTVSVSISIEALTATRTYSAGIVLSGARDDRTYSLSTDSVLVTLGGTVPALDTVSGASLTVIADVDGLGPGSHRVRLRVSLPAAVKLVAVSPAEVSVTVSLNASPTPIPSGP